MAPTPPSVWVRLLAAALLGFLLVVLAAPPPASAHAALIGTSPANGARLDAAPSEVVLTFNEPVSTGEAGLRVFNDAGERVDAGPVPSDASQVAVGLPSGLGDGVYVVAYRVISADSHPIAGVLTFQVGDVAPLDQETIDGIAGVDAGFVGTLGSLLRGVVSGAVLLAVGSAIFLGTVARGPADRARAARLGRRAAMVGLGAIVLHVPVQAAAVSGYGLLQAVTDGGVLGDTLRSSFGTGAMIRALGLALLIPRWSRGTPGAVHLWSASAVAIVSFLFDGHQRTVEPTWVLVTGDAVHLLGAAAWAGGVLLLFATLRATRVEDDPVGAAVVLARFSRLALWSVVVLAVAGTAMSLPLVRSVAALTTTAYGRTLLAKVVLVAVIVVVAAYNRRALVPAVVAASAPAGGAEHAGGSTAEASLPDVLAERPARAAAAWRLLRRTVALEVALLVVVVGLTGFLVSTQPAAEAAGLTGPTVVVESLTDDLDVNLVVDPSRTGLNAIHVYVLGEGGMPSSAVDDLRLEFTYLPENIGPIVIEPFVAGPGHWTANITDLRFVGAWEVRIVGGLGRFAEADLTIPFQINR